MYDTREDKVETTEATKKTTLTANQKAQGLSVDRGAGKAREDHVQCTASHSAPRTFVAVCDEPQVEPRVSELIAEHEARFVGSNSR